MTFTKHYIYSDEISGLSENGICLIIKDVTYRKKWFGKKRLGHHIELITPVSYYLHGSFFSTSNVVVFKKKYLFTGKNVVENTFDVDVCVLTNGNYDTIDWNTIYYIGRATIFDSNTAVEP